MKRAGTAAALILLPVVALGGCGSPPQVGPDREAFRAVDALYTAVGLRDVKAVESCGGRLRGLRAAGRMPAGAADALESIAAEALAQNWESAQARLSRFMEGQRR